MSSLLVSQIRIPDWLFIRVKFWSMKRNMLKLGQLSYQHYDKEKASLYKLVRRTCLLIWLRSFKACVSSALLGIMNPIMLAR